MGDQASVLQGVIQRARSAVRNVGLRSSFTRFQSFLTSFVFSRAIVARAVSRTVVHSRRASLPGVFVLGILVFDF